MPIPSLPTDNLYKFMTTLGILLCAFSMWSLMTINKEANDTLANIEGTNEATDMRIHIYEQRTDLLRRRTDTTTSDTAELQRRAEEANIDPVELQRRIDAIESVADDMTKEIERMQAEGEAILVEWPQNAKDSRIAIAKVKSGISSASQFKIGYWFGLLVACVGGGLWYWNFQRHQDLIVRRQAAEAGDNKAG